MMNGSSGLQNKHALKSMIMRCSTSNHALAVKVKFMKSKSILPKNENVREYPGPGYSRTFLFGTGNELCDKNEMCENIPALDILARFCLEQVMNCATKMKTCENIPALDILARFCLEQVMNFVRQK